MAIKVFRFPGTSGEVDPARAGTVEEALAEAGVDATGCEVRVNSALSALGAPVGDGDIVVVAKKIKGNS